MYLREAYHPVVAFVYGWVLLLVTQTGGMAAVAVTFAHYYREISGFGGSDGAIAAAALLALTIVNCFGARRQQRAKRPDAPENRRHRRHGGARHRSRRRQAASAA